MTALWITEVNVVILCDRKLLQAASFLQWVCEEESDNMATAYFAVLQRRRMIVTKS